MEQALEELVEAAIEAGARRRAFLWGLEGRLASGEERTQVMTPQNAKLLRDLERSDQRAQERLERALVVRAVERAQELEPQAAGPAFRESKEWLVREKRGRGGRQRA